MSGFRVIFVVVVLGMLCAVSGAPIDVIATDMTPVAPLPYPSPWLHEPRYVSGLGEGDSFTLFFEDRALDYQISYARTTSGVNGLSASATATNVQDTHFCVKGWPINIAGTEYAYRAWGALWNSPKHRFYVSNDLTHWVWVSEFEIPTLTGVPGGKVYYGFHDVVCLNGTYYAWGECNIGYTLVCGSANGDDEWEAFACVGGLHTLANSGPLQLPDVGTPTGSFFELGGDRGYGKVMVPGNDSGLYLAINTVAKPSLPPAALEAAFIDPANWTWHDGTTGLPGAPMLESTTEHDYRECWLFPNGNAQWTIIYDADFGDADGGKALGYAILSAPLPVLEVAIDVKPGSFPNAINLRAQGVVPVAILSSPFFDATTVDPATVLVAGAGVAVPGKSNRPMAHEEDVNGDGLIDLIVQVETRELDAEQLHNGYVTLTATTFLGQPVHGTDTVMLVGTTKE